MDPQRFSNPSMAVAATRDKWTSSVVRDGKRTGSVSTRGTLQEAMAVADRKHPKTALIELIDGSGQLVAERFRGQWYRDGRRIFY